MDFIQQLNTWAKGDLFQAKLMIAWIFIFCLPLIFYSIKTHHVFFKGMIIPLSLLILMLLGYGSYLLTTKGREIQKIETQYSENHQQTLKEEQAKANQNSKSYVMFKTIWGTLLLFSILFYFLLNGIYMKGLSAGCILLFLTLFITDTFFHARLKTYLSFLQELSN